MKKTCTGQCSDSILPEKYLGLGTMLPDVPPPSLSSTGKGSKDSSNASIPGLKTSESSIPSASSATQDTNQVVGTQTQGGKEIITLDEEQEGTIGRLKRKKRCTSNVWDHFEKRTVLVEEGGKKYEQVWGFCTLQGCKQKYTAESNHGTNAFRNHLKSVHNLVKGKIATH